MAPPQIPANSVVGTGSRRHTEALIRVARRLGIQDHVVLFGRVSDTERGRLMARAHAIVMASVREGWGLVVTEANACGTPAIVYNVPGLRDAVADGSTGFVVGERPEELTNGMLRLVQDVSAYRSMCTEAARRSSMFSLDDTATVVGQTLQRALAEAV